MRNFLNPPVFMALLWGIFCWRVFAEEGRGTSISLEMAQIVDALIEKSESGVFDSSGFAITHMSYMNGTQPHLQFCLRNESFKDNTERNRFVAKKYFGEQRYQALESVFIAEFKQSQSESTRILCMGMLSKMLASEKALYVLWDRFLQVGPVKGRDPNTSISGLENFALMESLAYLNREAMVEGIFPYVQSERVPLKVRVRALKAMEHLGKLEGEDFLGVALTSSHPAFVVQVYNVIDNRLLSEEQWKTTGYGDVVRKYSIFWLDTFAKNISADAKVDTEELALLREVSTMLFMYHRSGLLLEKEISRIRKSVFELLVSPQENVRECSARLMWETANDASMVKIAGYLDDGNPKVRAFAAYSFSKCSSETILQYKDQLLALLEDEDFNVRRWALFSLAKAVRYFPISSTMTEREFEQHKADVLQKL
ncbi:hypothetical protein P0Y35_04460 [Kiritimatiellaeota bacterium B1221]|nr:hypothetical protein [Kiritimatiellaeota bacterium B1221]